MRCRLGLSVFGLVALALQNHASAAVSSEQCVEVFRRHEALTVVDRLLGSDETTAVFNALTECAQDGDLAARAVAAFVLAEAYYLGFGVPKDLRAAARWYEKSAENGSEIAQLQLARMYEEGEGGLQNFKAAARWYEKAAARGDASGQFSLARLYDLGRGVTQDYKAAVRWYVKAAEQGHTDAQQSLGTMYAEGKGVVKDLITAHMWFNIAASQGSEEAAKNRERVATRMSSREVNEAQDRASSCVAAHLRNCGP
jgi:TPR repeat protein